MNLEDIEVLRKKARNKMLLCTIIPLILGIMLGVVTGKMFLFFIGLIVMIAGIIYAGKSTNQFSQEYKNMFVRTSLESVFDNLNYQPDQGLAKGIIADTKMMRMGDRYSSNDYVAGDYKGIHVEQADVHIEEEHVSTDSKGNTTTHYETLFKGRWMVFDFNKEFKANVQVVQKGFSNSKRGSIFSKKEEKYKKVQMEDADFNKKFKVFAQNEHDAFYILTPQMMDRIRRIAEGIKGKIIFCFVDNRLHVGVHNKEDSFEHSLFRKVDPEQVKTQVLGDIGLITGFVDELSLDTKLFKADAVTIETEE